MSVQPNFRTTQPHLTLSAVQETAIVEDGQIIALLRMVWGGRWLILAATLVALGLAQLWLSTMARPLYKATASILLDPRTEQFTDPNPVTERMQPIDETIRRTEVEILRGRPLLGTVVDDLRLVGDPEFNPALRPESASARIKSLIPLEKTDREKGATEARETAISLLANSISIRNLAPSLVFELSAVTSEAEKSTRIADQLAQNYIREQITRKRAESDEAIRWLGQRVSDLQHQIETSNAELSKLDTTNAETTRTLVQTRRLQKLDGDLTQARAALDASRKALETLPATASEAAHESRAAQVSIDAATLRNLERQYRDLEAGLRDETESATRQKLLEQQNETDLLVYGHFLTRLKDTIAREGRQLADSRLLAPAVMPSMPYLPRAPLVLSMSAMAGAAVGLTLLLLWQALRQTVRSAQDLQDLTGQKVIGQLPRLPQRRGQSGLAYLHDHPDSPAAEALRALRTNIVLDQLLLGQKIIAITSANPQEGKTTLSLGLARQMASLGKRVLVIEGDLRRRVFMEYLGLKCPQTLLGALTGETSLQGAVCADPYSGIDVLVGAKPPGNPADIFASNAFLALLDEAREQYDYIIIDTPPVLCVPDTRIILQGCDRALFVVNWNMTTKQQVRDGIGALHTSGRKLGGVILNRIDPKNRQEFYYSGYYSTQTKPFWRTRARA
ncbi:polysaccharide biosynthesis tyrosine autokinase (plasmid) [Thioclava sp. 'Guangxiensis']|uniref:polysaccharide biosynthesis tyrosine autokinase n=1 Tax=Thioclava sp. 'Guangxiensis' TaxID=3149044 RepID=UPI0032C3F8DD